MTTTLGSPGVGQKSDAPTYNIWHTVPLHGEGRKEAGYRIQQPTSLTGYSQDRTKCPTAQETRVKASSACEDSLHCSKSYLQKNIRSSSALISPEELVAWIRELFAKFPPMPRNDHDLRSMVAKANPRAARTGSCSLFFHKQGLGRLRRHFQSELYLLCEVASHKSWDISDMSSSESTRCNRVQLCLWKKNWKMSFSSFWV